MPLNALQRETLFSTVTIFVDTILESALPYDLRIQWLRAVIDEDLPLLPQVLQVLRQHPNLIEGIAEAIKVPASVRTNWGQFVGIINSNADQIPPALLKQLEEFNNYNPTLMVAMKLFLESIKANPNLNSIATELICLREAYLEMTPLTNYSYGDDYYSFYFRIGNVPFHLDNCGPTPIKGEVQADIKAFIEDRLAVAEKYRKESLERESKYKVETDKVVSQGQDLSFALNLFLDDAAEQRRHEQFKRKIISASEAPSAENSEHLFNISALLFPPISQQATNSCVLYRLSEANRTTFPTIGIRNAVILCFDPQGSSSSSGKLPYSAYFIENEQWVTQAHEPLNFEMGDLELSTFEEGLLKEDAETLRIIQNATLKRSQLTAQQIPSITGTLPQPVDNKRFQQMYGALYNRITNTLNILHAKFVDMDAALKQNKRYLELQKAEFCKVLLELQCSVVASCGADTVDWDNVNQVYQKQLNETYDMHIKNICDMWLSDRARHLNAVELEAEKNRLKSIIENVMQNDLKVFQSLKLIPNNIQKLTTQLEQQKNKLDEQLKRLKEQWAVTLKPLDALAVQCVVLRRLRSQIQQQGILAWPLTLQELWDIEKRSLKVTPNTLDTESIAEDCSILHYACWCGHLQLVKSLLTQGGLVSALSKEGYSALHFAVENTTETAIPLLELLLKITQTPDVFRNLKTKKEGLIPLHIAAEQGNLATVTWLLQVVPQSINDPDKYGYTALHKAAHHNHAEVIQHLLNSGANPRALNQRKNSPLVLTVLDGHKKTVQVFFDNGIWLTKAETERCLKAIPKHPTPHAVIECMSIAIADMLQALSRIKPQTNLQGVEPSESAFLVETLSSMPSYLPLFEQRSGLLPETSETVSVHTQQPSETLETKEAPSL